MPRRNLVIIIVASVLSVACYGRAQRNRFASMFAEAVDRISSSYVREVDERQLFEGAMTGMLGRLDPYSSYIGPEQYMEFKSDIDQEFGGIGIIVSPDPTTKRLIVLSPVVGTPAHRAGVLAGDMIVKVDGTDIEKFTMPETVKRLRGKPGTDVSLSLLRRGAEALTEITVTREVIKVPSVLGETMRPDGSWNFLLKDPPGIAYIRLTTFGEHSVEELELAIKSVEAKLLVGLILDLRSNAGGLLEAATSTCDMFLDEGEIVTLRGRGALVRDRRVASRGTLVQKELPVAVLVNRYSASASEIVAACLQDHGRAVIVGERSYGKGTVQNVIPLELGKSVMKLTTATFWRPSNANIHRAEDATQDDKWGVLPDDGYNVPLSDEEFSQLELARNRLDYPGSPPEPSSDDDGEHDAADPNRSETETEDGTDDNGSTNDEPADNGLDPNSTADESISQESELDNNDTSGDAPSEAAESAEDKTDRPGEPTGQQVDAEQNPIDDPQLQRAVEYILEAQQELTPRADAA